MTNTIDLVPPFTSVAFEIAWDADWNDPLPPLLENGVALDLTDKTLELYIRPAFDNSVLIKKLTSEGSAGIIIDDAAAGLASIYVERPVVQAEIPAGSWNQFLVLRTAAGMGDDDGWIYREVWRGPLIVRAGRT